VTKLGILNVAFFLSAFLSIQAQDVVGTWYAGGDYQNEITIWQADDGLYYGEISKILNPDNQDAKCTKCKGQQKDQALLGLVTINGLSKQGKEYTGGTSLDPSSGKTYKCKIWLDTEGNLKIRGYLGFLYGTETLTQVKH
jgi:uncharacterized protein (DUF2147 family)